MSNIYQNGNKLAITKGVIPTGQVVLSAEGEYDVRKYASAKVKIGQQVYIRIPEDYANVSDFKVGQLTDTKFLLSSSSIKKLFEYDTETDTLTKISDAPAYNFDWDTFKYLNGYALFNKSNYSYTTVYNLATRELTPVYGTATVRIINSTMMYVDFVSNGRTTLFDTATGIAHSYTDLYSGSNYYRYSFNTESKIYLISGNVAQVIDLRTFEITRDVPMTYSGALVRLTKLPSGKYLIVSTAGMYLLDDTVDEITLLTSASFSTSYVPTVYEYDDIVIFVSSTTSAYGIGVFYKSTEEAAYFSTGSGISHGQYLAEVNQYVYVSSNSTYVIDLTLRTQTQIYSGSVGGAYNSAGFVKAGNYYLKGSRSSTDAGIFKYDPVLKEVTKLTSVGYDFSAISTETKSLFKPYNSLKAYLIDNSTFEVTELTCSYRNSLAFAALGSKVIVPNSRDGVGLDIVDVTTGSVTNFATRGKALNLEPYLNGYRSNANQVGSPEIYIDLVNVAVTSLTYRFK